MSSTFTPVSIKASLAACIFLLRSSCFAERSSCFAARFSLRVPSHYLLYALSSSSVVCRNTQLPELFSIVFLSCLYINFACEHHIFNTIFSLRFVTYLCLPPSRACMFATVWTPVWTHIYCSTKTKTACALRSTLLGTCAYLCLWYTFIWLYFYLWLGPMIVLHSSGSTYHRAYNWSTYIHQLYLQLGCTANARTFIRLYLWFVRTVNVHPCGSSFDLCIRLICHFHPALLMIWLYGQCKNIHPAVQVNRVYGQFTFIRPALLVAYACGWYIHFHPALLVTWLYGECKIIYLALLVIHAHSKFLCSFISTCHIFRNMVTCAVHT